MRNIHLYNMKMELKDLAHRIRNGKEGRKPRLRTETNYDDWHSLERNRWRFRHLHIAYCLIRGRTMEQIERPAEDNLPNEKIIEIFIEEYNEAIRSSEKRLIA